MTPNEAFQVRCHDTGWTVVIPNPRGPSITHAFVSAESVVGWISAALQSPMPLMPVPPLDDIIDMDDDEALQ
jgi:hypothetical protein